MSDDILISFPVTDASIESGEWRGDKDETSIKILSLPTNVFATNVKEFVGNLSSAFKDIDASIAKFELMQIEITATITVSGKLSILAASGEIETQGAIKFVFKQKS